jgi:threonine dehydratase
MLDIPAEIFVPDIISPSKLARLQSYGARIHVVGAEFAEALEACRQHQDESGAILLHAYDQPEILAGQGTVALELEEQAPDLDTVLIAVGGGGLIGGVASWYQNQTRIIAVESTGTPTLHTALKKGTPCDISVSGSAADSLGARRTGTLGFHAAQHYVDQSLLVEEEAIAQTQKLLWEKFRQIAEPGGATALAALVTGAYKPEKGEHVGVLICGGNADTGKIVDSV